jgi:hypothetical protein
MMMNKYCQTCGSPVDEKALFCTKCGAKTQTVCAACGAANSTGDARCSSCGAVLGAGAPQQTVTQTVAAVRPSAPQTASPQQPQPQLQGQWNAQYSQQPQPQQYYNAPSKAPKPPKKPKTGLILGIVAGVVVIAAVLVVLSVLPHGEKKPADAEVSPSQTQIQLTPFPAELVVDTTKVDVSCDYTSPEVIIPANYRSLDDVVFMQLSASQGSADVLVEVEIPGFTQKYEQKVTVTRSETELRIRPPLVDGVTKTLNSAKDAQLNVSVTELGSGKVIVKDTKPIKLYSRYDMQWVDDSGTPYDENILAWLTPESEEIRSLLRYSADACNELTQGQLNAIVGYQEAVSGWSHEQITYVQAFCIMHTLADEFGVKYLMTPFSSTDSALQRIATPSEVINSAGGLCVETSVTMASALQAMNMHAVLILLPGHCQVAVETWPGAGEYFLIETTALTNAASAYSQEDFDAVIPPQPYTKDEWRQYMAQDGVTAIDCDLGEQLKIQSIG